MDQINLGESSGAQSIDLAKRKRGRPRKDPTLMYTAAASVPPGFERLREPQPHTADRSGGADNVIGQPVTGVVEGSFDAGYLLTVRIGNSPTNFRGVVLKPGHYVPITAENDVAPHLQMIRRTDLYFPGGPRNQDPAIQTAVTMPPKRKRKRPPPRVLPRDAPPVRGTVVPVVLQPVNLLTEPEQKPPSASQPHPMLSGDKDAHSVEPLPMVSPDQPVPANQIFVATQSSMILQTSHGSGKNDNKSFDEGTANIEKGANVEPIDSTVANNSSGVPDTETKTGQEGLNSTMENLGGVPNQEIGNANKPGSSTGFLQTGSVPKALFNFGTGRMTELLQAVQDNLKESREVQIAGQPPKAS